MRMRVLLSACNCFALKPPSTPRPKKVHVDKHILMYRLHTYRDGIDDDHDHDDEDDADSDDDDEDDDDYDVNDNTSGARPKW